MKILSEIINIQAAAIDDAFQSANGDVFGTVNGNNDLTAIGITPFLMTAGLPDKGESMLAQNSRDRVGG